MRGLALAALAALLLVGKAWAGDGGVDAGVDGGTDGGADTDTDTDSDTDTDMDSDTDTETEDDDDTGFDTEPETCPYLCLSKAGCSDRNGTVYDEYECRPYVTQVCCMEDWNSCDGVGIGGPPGCGCGSVGGEGGRSLLSILFQP